MPRPRTLEEPEHGWPLGWAESLREFRTHLAVERGLSAHTTSGYLSDLSHLAAWACDQANYDAYVPTEPWYMNYL